MLRSPPTSVALLIAAAMIAPTASATPPPSVERPASAIDAAADAGVTLARKSRRAKKAEAEAKEKADAEKAAAEKAAAEKAAADAKAEAAKAEDAAAVAEANRINAEAEAEERAAAQDAKRKSAEVDARAALDGAGLDARIRFLTDALARSLKRLPGEYRDQNFTVLPFEETGDETSSRQLGKVVSDLVMTNLARDHRIPLTERSQLSVIANEQALGELGALAEDQAVSLGKIANARAIIVGSVADTGASFLVNTRVLDVETAKIITADKVELPKEELIAFSADAVVLRSRSGAMFRSAVAPGWGQSYNREPIKGALIGGTVGVLAASALLAAGVGGLYAVSYDCWGRCSAPLPFDPSAIKTPDDTANLLSNLRNTANGAYITSLVFVGLAAGAWGFGVFDAYISGTDVDSLDEAMTEY